MGFWLILLTFREQELFIGCKVLHSILINMAESIGVGWKVLHGILINIVNIQRVVDFVLDGKYFMTSCSLKNINNMQRAGGIGILWKVLYGILANVVNIQRVGT